MLKINLNLYRVIPSKSTSELKRLSDKADEIIIASDLDREGEAIYHNAYWD